MTGVEMSQSLTEYSTMMGRDNAVIPICLSYIHPRAISRHIYSSLNNKQRANEC